MQIPGHHTITPVASQLGIIGSATDPRLHFLWEALQDVPEVSCSFFDACSTFQENELTSFIKTHPFLIGPTPLLGQNKLLNKTKLPIMDLLSDMSSGTTLLAGGIPGWLVLECKERGISVHDLMNVAPVAQKNAVATAEGLIAEMIIHSPKNLSGSTALVAGYGQCGKAIALRLRALGVDTHILLRSGSPSAAAAWCDAFPTYFVPVSEEISFSKDDTLPSSSHLSFTILPKKLEENTFDAIINTVPSPAFSSIFESILGTCSYYEVASAPGGLTPEAKETFAAHIYPLPGLPGRYSPKTSAHILLEAVLDYLRISSQT